MGYKRSLKAINLEETDRIPCAELIANPDFEHHVTSIDPYLHPLDARLKLIEILDLDLTFGLNIKNEPVKKSFTGKESSIINKDGNRVVRWGTGTTSRWNWGKGYSDVEQVLEFNPTLPGNADDNFWPTVNLSSSVEELGDQYNMLWHQEQDLLGDRSMVMGRYYLTLFILLTRIRVTN